MIKNKKHIASNLFVIYYKQKEEEITNAKTQLAEQTSEILRLKALLESSKTKKVLDKVEKKNAQLQEVIKNG